MRYLHPVQAHETFLASGEYQFFKDGQALEKREAWTIHSHPDGGRFVRVDLEARRSEGRSLLLEALYAADGGLLRLDLRAENASEAGGITELSASYQFSAAGLQVGYSMNGSPRQYSELDLPRGALIDIPLLIFRGATIKTLAEARTRPAAIFVPMWDYAQLFPGSLRAAGEPVDFAGEDALWLGQRQVAARRYTYRHQASAYWIDRQGVVIKRVNAFKQQEFVVKIRNYAMPAEPKRTE